MKNWQLVLAKSAIQPSSDSIIVRATAEVDVVPANEVIDGNKLDQAWQDIVRASHPTTGYAYRKVAPSIFDPINLDKFLAVRCRAVSGLEKHGANVNGDGFPSVELERSYSTLIAKGFYVEHRSFDPENAIGINAHAQWMPEDQFVVTVSLIDKEQFPWEAEEIRRTLANKKAGVSIGCIAGSAECSVCGNVAKKKNEICAHMLRGHHMCVKGKKISAGQVAYDICRDLTFYELSYTKLPADRDALSQYVFGADMRFAKDEDKNKAEEKTEDTSEVGEDKSLLDTPSLDIDIPDPAKLDRMIDTAVKKAFTSRINKLIKTKIEQELAPYLKEIQVKLKPGIEEKVDEKKETVEKAVSI